MTQTEFDNGYDGMHVPLTCENHPDLRWSCKRVALSLDKDGKYRYNGARSLFYSSKYTDTGDGNSIKECDCASKLLYALIQKGR